jgi:antitoxin MazE
MNLQVAKWGNSLAVRLPAEVARVLDLKEGSTVEAGYTVDGCVALRPAKWDREAFHEELRKFRESMPMTDSTLIELRRQARY